LGLGRLPGPRACPEWNGTEGALSRAAKARETLQTVGLDHAEVVGGEFANVLPQLLDRAGPVGFAFVDGDHHAESTIRNVSLIRSHMPDGSVLVVDDISWSDGMAEAWSCIRKHRRVDIALDFYTVGLCWLGGSEETTFTKIALW